MKKFTMIKGVSEQRRLPRLGVIRLGIKETSKNGTKYPKETSYFVVPDEVARVYGKEPKEIDVMLVTDDRAKIFPCAYKFYGSSRGLVCSGDGVEALEKQENGDYHERTCPCDKLDSGKCKQVGVLMVLLPKVNVGGIYQITTSSYNSIVDINSGLDYVENLLGRSCALVPLKLRRVPTETHFDDKKQVHYTMQILFQGDIDYINQLNESRKHILMQGEKLALPEPVEQNPEFDETEVLKDVKDSEETADVAMILKGFDEIGTIPLLNEYSKSIGQMYPNLSANAKETIRKTYYTRKDQINLDLTMKRTESDGSDQG